MDLVFDIGSTETTVGVFTGDQLLAHWRLASDARRTADEYAVFLTQLLRDHQIQPDEISRASMASVMPPVAALISAASERALQREVLVVDARQELPVRLDVEEPLNVGADRIVNVIAAHQNWSRDAIVVDLGTATTYDCVTRDGTFIGGAIAPGVRTSADRLTQQTAKLPRVDLSPPESAIGRRTEACLQSGVFFGAVDAVDGMVDRIRAEWNRPAALVIATGGLAGVIASQCRTIDVIEPFLTLHGIRLARDYIDSRGRRPGFSPTSEHAATPP